MYICEPNNTDMTQVPIIMTDGSIVKASISQDQFGQYSLKIKYPKVGRSHYYSVVNYIDSLFDEQYPEWSEILHNQLHIVNQ
jgi:hypothetical protein